MKTETKFDYDLFLEWINGRTYRLDGVHGHFTVERICGMTEIIHNPSAYGKRSDRYKKTKSELKDDFVTRVDLCESTMVDLFQWYEKNN